MRTALIAFVFLLLIAAVLLAVGWMFSSRVIVPAPYGLMPEFEVLASSRAPDPRVTLPRTEEPGQHARVDVVGDYGLLWDGGYGRLGAIVADDPASVTRRLTVVAGQLPAAGTPALVDNVVYRSDPGAAFGMPFEELRLQGPQGGIRAWYVPPADEYAAAGTGVLMLHGRRRGELIELLRFIPAFRSAGLHVLAQSYRNHDSSDPSDDGLYHYGASEWEDALAGARELAARGVDRIVLFGISMGGALALEALERWSSDLPEVVAVVLDSPLVDPYATFRLGAVQAGLPLPGPMTRLALLVAGWRTGTNFSDLVQANDAAGVAVPVMVVAGAADTTVPIESVDAFVAALRVPVTYHRLDGVEHVEAWNVVGQQRYTSWVAEFLAALQVRALAAG
ncbi:MAG TPA: alpha/beta fold hydrolase [Trueperaceae bacterium]